MGGSGSDRYSLSQRELEQLRDLTNARRQQQQLDEDVNAFLRRELLAANDRDVRHVTDYLDGIEAALADKLYEFDRLLFGGSVAKHTYVEGISDVDSLVVLADDGLADRTPAEFRNECARILRSRLPRSEVDDVTVGRMAVTVRYRNGMEIQLLPVVRQGDSISLPASDGQTWRRGVRPQLFADRLTQANRAQGNTLIPAIKLAKEVVARQIPEADRPSGYHVETLAVDAFASYDGPRTPKAMVTHLFQYAQARVVSPTHDLTGQSTYVDDYLGAPNSDARTRLAVQFRNIERRLTNAQSVDEWRSVFADE